MMYATDVGRILGDEDINLMTPEEIEKEGIHIVDDWDEWS